jgi:small subunit ribosomal protein S23
MGRINLAALRVRTRGLQMRKALAGENDSMTPPWANVIADIPPAQILTRQQPRPHVYAETRTKTLPKGPTQITQAITPHKTKNAKPKRLYTPKPIRYEEDSLRKRFFADHPWELARPRTLVETNGDQHAHADWSTGIKQPGIPVSGESVVQRQLWLLQNVADITVPEAYDIARKEFYVVRRKQQTAMRIAVEEAEWSGADFGRPVQSVGMSKEDTVYNEWLEWAAEENVKLMQSRAGFEGQQLSAEQKTLEDNAEQQPSTLGARYGGSREGFTDRSVNAPSARVGAPI